MEEKQIADFQENAPQSENIVDRFLAEANNPDFAPKKIKTIEDISKEYDIVITPTVADNILSGSHLSQGVGAQTATAIKNVLVGLSGLGDDVRIATGNIVNYVTGGSVGEELQNTYFESMQNRYADMAYNEAEVGGIRSELAQLAAGATSFAELAILGLATAGAGSLAQIAAQTMGEGTYNDMQAYIDEHGSLEGYRPEGSDIFLNVANTLFQVGSEAYLGVGSPRFFMGWSRGLWKEGASGFIQEGLQGVVSDLFEIAKDNKSFSDVLDNSDQYLRDAIIGAVLQGGLGAATYGAKRARSDRILAHSIAQVRGRQTPNKEDERDAKTINNAKERGYMTAFTEEFKKRFDATSPVGQLQQKVATAINDAYKAGKIDFGGASETQIAQKIESFAAQETLNAMEDSAERNQSIGEHELNSIVFKGAEGAKEGELWLAGLEPEVGERSVDLAKVLEYRQSGLAEINAELEVLDGEIKQLKKQLAETTADVKEAQKELLKEQIKKKEGQAEAKRLKKSQLEASNARLYASIEKMSAPKAEKASEQKSLKSEREQEKAVKEQRKQAREKKPETAKKEETKLGKNEFDIAYESADKSNTNLIEVNLGDKKGTTVRIIKSKAGKFSGKYTVSIIDRNARQDTLAEQGWMNAGMVDKDGVAIPWEAKTFNSIEEAKQAVSDTFDEKNMLKQSRPDQSRLDKGDTYRGAYDEKLKRIILNEKSDLTTIQHEFAHYWIQNNFRWYRSGLASDDWKRNWERVEQALGIEPTDKYLSKVASEKFARAYERYIMEDKVAPEYQWAFAEFQEFYNEVYEDLKAEYFDLNEELSPELIDWFNRQRPVAPEQVAEMRQNQVRSAIAQAPDNTIIESVGDGYAVVEENEQGEIESTIVVPKETIAEEQFGVPAKKTKSGLQESLRKRFGDDVNVDELVALDSVETLAQAESIIASNPQLAWEQMLSDSTNDVKRAYLYKAFAKMAENDPQIAVDLSNTNMAQWAREKGQAIQALNINDELGLSPHTILAYMQNAKGKMSQERLVQAQNETNIYRDLSTEDSTAIENETECLI